MTPPGSAGGVLSSDNKSDGLYSSLLTVADVALVLKLSPTSVRRMQQQRRIPFIKVGGTVRFGLDDVVAYIAAQRVEAVRQ